MFFQKLISFKENSSSTLFLDVSCLFWKIIDKLIGTLNTGLCWFKDSGYKLGLVMGNLKEKKKTKIKFVIKSRWNNLLEI